jgi:DNA-binding response OmpR family regulator
MNEESGLNGQSVLVVEDDYYLAADMARLLRELGADVVGPYPDADSAIAAISATRPDIAVVDVNLGAGPSFGIARALQQSGIPFVLMTGYDASVIPDEFSGVGRLKKPVEFRSVVNSLAGRLNP